MLKAQNEPGMGVGLYTRGRVVPEPVFGQCVIRWVSHEGEQDPRTGLYIPGAQQGDPLVKFKSFFMVKTSGKFPLAGHIIDSPVKPGDRVVLRTQTIWHDDGNLPAQHMVVDLFSVAAYYPAKQDGSVQ